MSLWCVPGPSRGDPEEAEREEGYDERCEEVSERWGFFVFWNMTFIIYTAHTKVKHL